MLANFISHAASRPIAGIERVARFAFLLALASFGLLDSASPAKAGAYTANFQDGTLDGLVVNTTGNYTYSISGGQLNVSGSGIGSITFDTPFDVVGDFTATVAAAWSVLPQGQMELTAVNGAYVGFVNDGYVLSQVGSDFNATLAPYNNETFYITRQGDTVTTGLCTETDPSLTAPTTVGITLSLPTDLYYDGPLSGSFSEFTVTADSIPEPASLSVFGFGIAGVLARRRAA